MLTPLSLILFLPDYISAGNFLIALFGFLVLVGLAILVTLYKGRGEISTLQVSRADAAEGLVKIRDAQIVTLECRVKELEEELESVTAEHRALAGISISKLMEFWAIKESCEAEIGDLKRQIRILSLRKDGDVQQ